MKFGRGEKNRKVGRHAASANENRSMANSADNGRWDEQSEYTVEIEEIKAADKTHRHLSIAPDLGLEMRRVKRSSSSFLRTESEDEEAQSNIELNESEVGTGALQNKHQDSPIFKSTTRTMDEEEDFRLHEEENGIIPHPIVVVNKSQPSKLSIACKFFLIALLCGGALAGSYFATKAIITSIHSKKSASLDNVVPVGQTNASSVNQSTETSAEQAKRSNEVSQLIRLISENSTLEDPSSPQSQAFKWIAYNDPLRLSLTGNNNVSEARLKQRYIMSLFYYSLNGNGWKNITNWLTSEPECNWDQVWCSKNNRVTKIDLTGKGLKGSIPHEIGNLVDLEKLVLYKNKITKFIPSSIGQLSKLGTLDLGKNQITGTLPKNFFKLGSLKIAFLKDNKFEGSISSLIGGLSNLEMLVLSQNAFQGSAPRELGNLTSLRE
jgi:hypothetical protein